MKKSDFESLKKMISFMQEDLRHCIGVNANFVVALALSTYTEAFGHLLPGMQKKKNYECYNEFLRAWMNYGHLIDPKNPGSLYDVVRNGLTHEYMLKTDAYVKMGVGEYGLEVVKKGTKEFVCFNVVTYYNDFMVAVNKYWQTIQKDKGLQKAFDERMKGKQRLK